MTSTSNIHIGLATWTTSTTYHPGDRVSHSGNAYQCVTTGTSSGGPTGTGSSITDGTVVWKYLSSIDYTTVQSWLNAIPSTLTQPYVGLMWNDGAINISSSTQTYVDFTGHTTSSTNTITLTCAAGESIRNSLATGTQVFAFSSSAGVSFVLPNVSNAGQNYFNIDDANVILDGLQFVDPNSTSNSTIINANSGTTLRIQNCIVDGYAQDNGAFMLSGDTIQVVNSLIVDRQASSGSYLAVVGDTASCYAVNSTFVSINSTTSGIAFSVNNAAGYARNCIFSGYTVPIGGLGNNTTADHCVFTSSSVGPYGVDNGNNKFSKSASNQFISPTTDFRLSYASDALNAGSTDTTDLPTSNDIAGTTRPQGSAWDIGAWELVPLVTGSGVAASGQAGSLQGSESSKITGVAASGQIGSPTLTIGSNATVTLTGVAASGATGTAKVTINASISGTQAAGQIGSPSLQIPGSAGLSGQFASGQIASIQGSVQATLTGTTAAGQSGSFSNIIAAIPNGAAASGSTGSLTITSSTVLTGVSANANKGTLIAGPSSLISGVSATGGRGTVMTSTVIASVTSNIHYNLSAWSNQTYTSGNRIFTGSVGSGNVYQCTTSGSSTVAPTGTGTGINNGGSAVWKYLSSYDFATLQTWSNAIPSNPTQPYTGYLWNNGTITTTSGTAFLQLSGHSTTSANSITLTCAPGESIKDALAGGTTAFAFSTTAGVNFQLPSSGTGGINYFDISDANVIIDGLQFQDPNSSSGSTILCGETGSSPLTVRNCIFDGYGQPSATIVDTNDTTSTGKFIVENCLVVDRQTSPGNGFTVAGQCGLLTVVNCTLIAINSQTNDGHTGAVFCYASSGSPIVRNTAIFGWDSGATVASSSLAITVDHCCSSASGLGSNAVDGGNNLFSRNINNQFISPTSDFRLTYASDMLNAGVTDTTDLPGSNDIANHSRPQGSAWDIGAWELVPLVSGSGVAATGQSGSVIANVNAVSSGVSGSGSAGTVTVFHSINATGSPTGVNASGLASSPTTALQVFTTGAQASALVGQVSSSVPGSVTLQGLSATGSATAPTISLTLHALTGTSAIGSVGIATGNPSGQTSGTSTAGQTGSFAISLNAVLSGSFGQGVSGTITPTPVPNGVIASGSSGTVIAKVQSQTSGVSASGLAGVVATSSVTAAALSNIHFGLSAWQGSTAYTVGNRVSSNGNAYQCTHAGTSGSSGPSGTGSSINDNGVTWKYLSSIDFTSVQAWANAIPSTLTVPYIGQVWNDTPITTSAGTPFLRLYGHNTSNVNTITLTCAPGESFRDTLSNRSTAFAYNVNNGVSFVLPSAVGGTNYFDITDANAIIDGFQFQDPYSASNSTILQMEIGSTGSIMQNCIFDGYGQAGGASIIGIADQNIIRDCLIVDREATTSSGAVITTENSSNSIIVNNTIVNVLGNTASATALIVNESYAVTVNRNNYYIGFTTPITGTTSVPVPTDHCVFSQANFSYTGCSLVDNGNNLTGKSITNQFISTSDFRTKFSSDGLLNAATDTADLPAANDISYAARPSGAWDVGAWQFLPFSATSSSASGQVGSFSNFIASSNATISGINAQGNVGSLSKPILTVTTIGVAATGQISSAIASLTYTFNIFSGRAGTGQIAGFVNYQNSNSIVGTSSSAYLGTLVPTIPQSITGQSAAANVGTVAGVGPSFGLLTGVNASGQAGSDSVTVGGISTGLNAIASVANLLVSISNSLNGRAATGQVGSEQFNSSVVPIGTTAQTQIGTLTSSITGFLSGTTANGQIGLVVPSAIIAGISSSGQSGYLAETDTITSSSIAASATNGSLINNLLPKLSGLSAAGNVGSLVTQTMLAVTGTSATGQFSSVAVTLNAVLSGNTASASVGSVSIQSSSPGLVAVIGSAGSAQVGTIVPQITKTISGLAASATSGVINLVIFTGLSGQSASATVGAVVQTIFIALSGLTASGNIASLQETQTAQIIGQSGSAFNGSIAPMNALALSGQTASTSVGNLATPRSEIITGLNANGLLGTLLSTVFNNIVGNAAVSFAGGFAGSTASAIAITGLHATGGVANVASVSMRSISGLNATASLGSPLSILNGQIFGLSTNGLIAGITETISVNAGTINASPQVGSLAQVRMTTINGLNSAASAGVLSFTAGGNLAGLTALGGPAFRRASVATYIDSNGILQIAGNDTERYTHNVFAPFTLIGALLESASTNYSPHGDMLNWNLRGTTTSSYGYGAPDGQGHALAVIAGSGTGLYDISYNWVGSPSTIYTHSVYAKANGCNYLHMQLYDFGSGSNGSGIEAWFDLGNGLVVSADSTGSGSNASAAISLGPNGFYRCCLTGIPTTNASLSLEAVLRLSDSNSDNSINGDGSSGILVWGDQIEQASTASSYIPTSGSTQIRAADIPSQNLFGLTVYAAPMGVEGDTAVGSFSISESPANLSGLAAQSACGSVSFYSMTNIVGLSASGTVASFTPQIMSADTGSAASGQAGSLTVSDFATISGSVSTGQTATITSAVTVQPFGQMAAAQVGMFGLTLLANLIGLGSSASSGSLQSQLYEFVSTAQAAGQTGLISYVQAGISGQAANTTFGNLSTQQAIFPASASAAAETGNLNANTSEIMSGVSASSNIGNFSLQLFALPASCSGLGRAGVLADQIIYVINGTNCLGQTGSPISQTGGISVGLAAQGRSGTLRLAQTTGQLNGEAAIGMATPPIGRNVVFPLAITSAGYSGTLSPKIFTAPLGVAATGSISTLYGWLVIIETTATLSLPTASVLATSNIASDDEPFGIAIYQVPQVISLVYPVLGNTVGIYAYPQLVNLVIEEYNQI